MHVLFVHQNFPAQFGPFAFRLARTPGHRCTFVSQKVGGLYRGVRCLRYQTRGGATEANHFCSRTFENAVWHAAGVHDALAAAPDIKPDLVVGHSGFGSTLFLRDLYPGVPVVNLQPPAGVSPRSSQVPASRLRSPKHQRASSSR